LIKETMDARDYITCDDAPRNPIMRRRLNSINSDWWVPSKCPSRYQACAPADWTWGGREAKGWRFHQPCGLML